MLRLSRQVPSPPAHIFCEQKKKTFLSKYTSDKRGPPVVRARLRQLRRPRPRPRRREVPHGRQRPDVPRRQPRGRRRAVVVPHQRAVAGEQDGAGDAALTAVELSGECNKSIASKNVEKAVFIRHKKYTGILLKKSAHVQYLLPAAVGPQVY